MKPLTTLLVTNLLLSEKAAAESEHPTLKGAAIGGAVGYYKSHHAAEKEKASE